MESLVAVAVKLENGQKRFFLTWGRIFDAVDGSELEKIVLKYSSGYALDGNPIVAEVAYSLQDAAYEPYFYEAFYFLCSTRVPTVGSTYKKWVTKMRRDMRQGKHLFYCGSPKQRDVASSTFWSMRIADGSH